jgi:hypothetical protein
MTKEFDYSEDEFPDLTSEEIEEAANDFVESIHILPPQPPEKEAKSLDDNNGTRSDENDH